MILIRADERLKTVFERLIQTMGNQVEWNGIFAIAAGNLMLPGKVKSLFFQLDQKKIFSRVMEFPADFNKAESTEGNEVLANCFNIILYAFGRWGVIPGLRVDKDYGQLIKLFRAVLEEISVEPDFTGDYIKFYYKEELVSYEEVIRLALDWAKVENGLSPDEEEEELLGLWHSVRWLKEAATISRAEAGRVDAENRGHREDERIGHNFYEVDYLCPICGSGLHMVVFEEHREPLIETEEGRVFLSRAYTCNECQKFFTPRPERLIQEGDLYSLNFSDDKKAYEDYLDLLGRTGGRYANFKMNEFERDRLHPKEPEKNASARQETEEKNKAAAEYSNQNSGGIHERGKQKTESDKRDNGSERGKQAADGSEAGGKHGTESGQRGETGQKKGGGPQESASQDGGSQERGLREGGSRKGGSQGGGLRNIGLQEDGSHKSGLREGGSRKGSASEGESESRGGTSHGLGTREGGDGSAESSRGREAGQKTGGGSRETSSREGSSRVEESRGSESHDSGKGSLPKTDNQGTRNVEKVGGQQAGEGQELNRVNLSDRKGADFIRRRAGECQGKSYHEVKEILNEIKQTDAPEEVKNQLVFQVMKYKTALAQKEAAYFVSKLPERLGRKEYELSLKRLSEYEKEDIAPSLDRLEAKRNETEKLEINDVIKKSRKINREDMLRLHESLKQQDFRPDNLKPFLDKIYDKVMEMDQAEIDRICPDLMDISFGSGIQAMKEIQGGMFLPELKKKTIDMLDKKLTKMKIDENAQLVRKLKKELESALSDRQRIHFYDARTVLGTEESEEKEFCIRATQIIAGSLNQYEYPVIICDSSYFQNGKEGFLLTPDRLFYKSMFQSGCVRIMDIESLTGAGLFQKGLQAKLQSGGKKKLPQVVKNDSRDILLKILGGFLVYLQEKPESRKITYMARTRHDVVCCYRCGHTYKGQGVCPKCGYRENQK